MTELNVAIIANNDELRYLGDGFGPTGTVQVAPPVLRVGFWAATVQWQGAGLRFQNITIPQGATINSAKLTFTADSNWTAVNCNCKISAQDADSPDDFVGEDWDSLRTKWNGRTSARVSWSNIESWTKDSEYESPDIASVIQEIVNRSGWQSGNNMVLFWDDWAHDTEGPPGDKTRSAYPYNIDSAKAVSLYVSYTEITAPAVTTDPATSIEQTTVTPNGTLSNDGGEACDCSFEYGETAEYGTETATQSKETDDTFEQEVRGLRPGGILYHFRAKATNSAGTSYGADRTFHTEALSAEAYQALGKHHSLGRHGL